MAVNEQEYEEHIATFQMQISELTIAVCALKSVVKRLNSEEFLSDRYHTDIYENIYRIILTDEEIREKVHSNQNIPLSRIVRDIAKVTNKDTSCEEIMFRLSAQLDVYSIDRELP